MEDGKERRCAESARGDLKGKDNDPASGVASAPRCVGSGAPASGASDDSEFSGTPQPVANDESARGDLRAPANGASGNGALHEAPKPKDGGGEHKAPALTPDPSPGGSAEKGNGSGRGKKRSVGQAVPAADVSGTSSRSTANVPNERPQTARHAQHDLRAAPSGTIHDGPVHQPGGTDFEAVRREIITRIMKGDVDITGPEGEEILSRRMKDEG